MTEHDPSARKVPIAKRVAADAAGLQGCRDFRLLNAWAADNGIRTPQAFTAFKRALAAIGIDYDALRRGEREAALAALASAPRVKLALCAAASSFRGRFSICTREGEPLWFGRFFKRDNRESKALQTHAELDVLRKAIWLAAKGAALVGEPAIAVSIGLTGKAWSAVNLMMSVESADRLARKSFEHQLVSYALKHQVRMRIEELGSGENPASDLLAGDGYKAWSPAELRALVRPAGASDALGRPPMLH